MEPTASRSSPAGLAPDAGALAAFLDCEADLDALQRCLLAAAVHPAWGGARRAWIAAWDERRALLECERSVELAADPADLLTAIGRARRAAPAPETVAGAPAWRVTPESLEGAAATAWRSGEPASGAGAEQPGAPWCDAEVIAVLPLRRQARPHGLLVLDRDGRAAAPAAVEALAQAANAALAAQVRAAEARRRARHLVAIAEFGRTAIGGGNLAETLHTLARIAAQALHVRHAAVYRVREDGGVRLEVAQGPPAVRESQARAFAAAAAETVRSQRRLAGHAPEIPAGAETDGTGPAVWAFEPIVAYGQVLGVLAAWETGDRPTSAPDWERGDLEALAALADHAALLFEHARRLDELALLERRRTDLASRLREQDRLAALGEMAGRVAEDARQPLTSVLAFAARALRDLADDDPRREALEMIRREAERADAMLAEQLAYARLEPPRLRMESLNGIVQESLRAAAEALSRRRVRLVKKLAPDLPALLLDAARIRRVVSNILACALEAVPLGGRVSVETRRAGAHVVLDLLHDRTQRAGDALEQLFAPFGAASAGGAGAAGAALGLGVAQQIVREHGGEIRVRSDDEWSSVFSVTLPVLDNQDRRGGRDRRGARPERRRRPPEA